MRKAVRVATGLVMAFDTARRAFDLDTPPGWDAAAADLRAALNAARDLGDVGGLPCPLAWFTSAQAQARVWLEAEADVRRGLTSAVAETMRALSRFAASSIAEPEPAIDRRGG